MRGAVVADISGGFDNISHKSVIDAVQEFPAHFLVERWLRAGILEPVRAASSWKLRRARLFRRAGSCLLFCVISSYMV